MATLLEKHGTSNQGDIYSGPKLDWNTARDASTGTVDTAGLIMVAALNDDISLYSIYKGFLEFDTSELPLCVVSAATVGVKTSMVNGAVVGIVEGTQANPLISSDYDSHGSVEFATRMTPVTNDIFYTFSLGSAGMAAVNSEGITRYCLRDAYDLDDVAPDWFVVPFVMFYSETDATVTNHPYLTIDYTPVSSVVFIFGGQ
jgi:hypothetical protein